MTTISKVRYSRGVSRRALLKSGGAAVAAAALPAPMVWGQETKNITLRQFGT
ncbi:MAG: twin-arginine translocation signal domain-containing protein, partial [Pseudomonadota bacterium]